VQWIPRYVRLTQQFNQGLERLSSRARVDSRVVLLQSLYRHVPVRQASSFKPRPKTKTTYASQSQSLPALTASLLHTSFPHYLSSFSVLGQNLPTESRQPRGSHTRTFISHFYFSFVRLSFLYSIPFTGAPRTPLRYKT
jgi:hypothetical protein